MSYFEPSMETPERIGKAAGDIVAAFVVVSVLALILTGLFR